MPVATDPRSTIPGPIADDLDRVATLVALASSTIGLDSVARAGRNEAWSEIRQWREDEQAVTHRRMWDLEESLGGTGVNRGGEWRGAGGPLHRQLVASEHEEIEVQLAWTPALSLSAAGLALQALQRDEQVGRA